MAGPTCGVLIAAEARQRADAEIDSLIVAVGDERDDGAFWVRTTRAIGGAYEGEPRPFVWGFEPWEPDPTEVASIAAAFGVRPSHMLGIGAMCNTLQDHRLLGELSVWLAEKLGGVVDAGGRLELPDDLPGRVIFFSWSESLAHVLDGPAMRGWLAHPHFRMIK